MAVLINTPNNPSGVVYSEETVQKLSDILRDAQKKLLEFFNSDYDTYFQNWGLVRCNYPYDSSSFNDGTRSYSYDSRSYYIEEDNEEKR